MKPGKRNVLLWHKMEHGRNFLPPSAAAAARWLSPTEREQHVKRGDIYFANLDPVVGSEQGGTRPVLIVQNDLGNRFSPTVIVLPLTSKVGKAPLPTHVPLLPPQGGVRKPSIILCEQVRTLEKSRLTLHLGTVGRDKMALVEKALARAVGQRETEDAQETEKEDGET